MSARRIATPGVFALRALRRAVWRANGTREVRNPSWVHPGERRLRHRLGQRVAFPLYHGRIRRRGVRDHVPGVPGHLRASGAHHGVRRRPRKPALHRAQLRCSRTGGYEVACVQVAGPGRQLPAHDVLHHRGRLDARLRGEKRLRRVRGAGKLPGGRRFQRPACRSGAACRVHAHYRRRGRRRHARRRAEGRGARDEGHDDGPVRGARRPVRARGHAARRS